VAVGYCPWALWDIACRAAILMAFGTVSLFTGPSHKAHLPIPPILAVSGVACSALHHLNAASLYQFNGEKCACIFDCIGNYTLGIFKYPIILLYCDTDQACCTAF